MATVAISSDFLTAFAALPRHVQGKVTDFVNKFRNDPTSPGINYEKINGATDKKMCSVRIDDTYRGIVVRQQETGVYLFCGSITMMRHTIGRGVRNVKSMPLPGMSRFSIFSMRTMRFSPSRRSSAFCRVL